MEVDILISPVLGTFRSTVRKRIRNSKKVLLCPLRSADVPPQEPSCVHRTPTSVKLSGTARKPGQLKLQTLKPTMKQLKEAREGNEWLCSENGGPNGGNRWSFKCRTMPFLV